MTTIFTGHNGMSILRYLPCFFLGIICTMAVIFFLNEKETRQNVKNSLKVQLGMSIKDVVNIMGPAEAVRFTDNRAYEVFYEPPFLASSGISFELDSNNKVQHIILYE
jgi:hypothetical protein